jgi:hypothetical protein
MRERDKSNRKQECGDGYSWEAHDRHTEERAMDGVRRGKEGKVQITEAREGGGKESFLIERVKPALVLPESTARTGKMNRQVVVRIVKLCVCM